MLPENVSLNYVQDICAENIADPPVNATLIHNRSEIDQIPTTECSKLINSIAGHRNYPLDDRIYGGYVFKEILDAHETQHYDDWTKYVENHIDEYENIHTKISNECQDFINDADAREKILRSVRLLFFTDFWIPLREEYLREQQKRTELEQDLHQRKQIQDVITLYELKIRDHCNDN